MKILTLTSFLIATTIAQAGEMNKAAHAGHGDLKAPKVLKAVAPLTSSYHIGEEIILEFTVTTDGRATNVRARDINFQPKRMEIAAKMEKVLPRWRFEPAKNEMGQPVSVRVRMPVIVENRGMEMRELISMKQRRLPEAG